jgi:hypothetical protein
MEPSAQGCSPQILQQQAAGLHDDTGKTISISSIK